MQTSIKFNKKTVECLLILIKKIKIKFKKNGLRYIQQIIYEPKRKAMSMSSSPRCDHGVNSGVFVVMLGINIVCEKLYSLNSKMNEQLNILDIMTHQKSNPPKSTCEYIDHVKKF